MVCCSLETGTVLHFLCCRLTHSLPGSVAASKKKNPFAIYLVADKIRTPYLFLGALLTFLSQFWVSSTAFGIDAV